MSQSSINQTTNTTLNSICSNISIIIFIQLSMAREVTLERGDGYGFHLASENGNQFIRKIDKKSPAEHAGILDGDRLIGVSCDVIFVIQSNF